MCHVPAGSDFANGFLVAEILSRYYDKDVSMHSYDNGIGVKVKKDNWEQLLRLFARVADLEPLAASRADVEAVIHCQNGAAVAFLSKLYQCLTKRSIPPPVALAPHSAAAPTPAPTIAGSSAPAAEVPPYAKPTGSALIREKMRASPEIAETQDEVQRGRFARDVHSQHEEALQVQRTDSAGDRYPALRSASKATVLRGATKPMRNDDPAMPMLSTQNIVKEVQIKSLSGKGLEKLRATREAKENEALGLGMAGGPGNYSGGGGSVGATFDGYGGLNSNGTSSNPELLQRRRPLDLLSEAVAVALSSAGISQGEVRGAKDHRAFESFVESAYANKDADSAADSVNVLHSLVDDSGVLTLACLEFPREFWKVVGVLWPFITELDDEHALFSAVIHFLSKIGAQSVRRDHTASTMLLTEYILPKCATGASIPLRNPGKRAPLLRLVMSFVPQSALAHLQTVKRLREALTDYIPLFIHSLAVLLSLEATVELLRSAAEAEYGDSDADIDALVDLYHYYSCIGLETTCEKLRAACLSMLTGMLHSQRGSRGGNSMGRSVVALVVDLLPRLTQLSARYAWWEVKAQLLLVASEFLLVAPLIKSEGENEQDLTDQIEQCLTIVDREFHPTSALHVRRVGLVCLASNLASYQELVPLYVDVLFSLPDSVRHVMLEPADEHDRDEYDGGENVDADAARRRLPMRGASGNYYPTPPLPPLWDSVAVAKQIFYERKDEAVADAEAMLVLQWCFDQLVAATSASVADTGDEEVGLSSQEQALALFDQMKSYVLSGLLDPQACHPSARVVHCALSLVLSESPSVVTAAASVASDVLEADGPLAALLPRLVTREVEDERQQAAVRLLHDAHALGEPLAALVVACVARVRGTSDSGAFQASLFSIALDVEL
jgi:hypothetical protein